MSFMKKYCFALDLKNDKKLIEEYDHYHKIVWPEIVDNIYMTGIVNMEIYRLETRLFMIMEASDSFSMEEKEESDLMNQKVQEWEELMWKYQEQLPWAKPGEKWVLMKNIFSLEEHSKVLRINSQENLSDN